MKARPNVVLAVVVAVVAVLAIVAAILAANRQPPTADRTTPAGTVQLFLTALIDGDDEAAVALLDPALGCKAPLPSYAHPSQRLTFAIVDSRTFGERASVEVDITEYGGGGPLDSWSHRETYALAADAAGWLITGQPWPVYACK